MGRENCAEWFQRVDLREEKPALICERFAGVSLEYMTKAVDLKFTRAARYLPLRRHLQLHLRLEQREQ